MSVKWNSFTIPKNDTTEEWSVPESFKTIIKPEYFIHINKGRLWLKPGDIPKDKVQNQQGNQTVISKEFSFSGASYNRDRLEQLTHALMSFCASFSEFYQSDILCNPLQGFQLTTTPYQLREFQLIIEDHRLGDLFHPLLVIAIAIENFYVEKVNVSLRREVAKRRLDLADVQDFTRLLEIFESLESANCKRREKLNNVTFNLSKGTSKMITGKFLNSIIIEAIKDALTIRGLDFHRSIRKEMDSIMLEQSFIESYQKSLSRLVNEFLKNVGAFDYGTHRTKRKACRFIADLLNFCHIEFFDSETKHKLDVKDKREKGIIANRIRTAVA